MNINLRENITRTIKYSIVTIKQDEKVTTHNVYGATSEKNELIKYFRSNRTNIIPSINVKVVTERRTMSLDNFLNNSILINESEEN